MFKWFKAWWERFFRGVSQEPKETKKAKKKRRKARNLKGLKKELDNIYGKCTYEDYIEKNFSINTSKYTVKALRALGVFLMPENTLYQQEDEAWVNTNYYEFCKLGLPSILFIGLSGSDQLMYACKLPKKKFRHMVEWLSNDEELYEVGSGFPEDNPPRWLRKANHMMIWVHFFYAINRKTGVSRVLKYRFERNVIIPTNKNNYPNSYHKVELLHPNHDIKEGEKRFEDGTLAGMMNLWAQRDSHWQVEAVRGDHKITTCIAQNEAKDYFKDRYVMDGMKRKAIFHWVKAHYRKTQTGKTTVKTHFRGEKEFSWGEYDMSIRLPGMDSYMLSTLDIEPVVLDFDESEEGYIPMDEAVGMVSGKVLH